MMTALSTVGGAVGVGAGGRMGTAGGFVRDQRLVASRYVMAGGSSLSGTFTTLRRGASADAIASSRGAVSSMAVSLLVLLLGACSSSGWTENSRMSSSSAATWLVSRGGNGELGVGLLSAAARSLMLAEMRSSADGVGMVT